MTSSSPPISGGATSMRRPTSSPSRSSAALRRRSTGRRPGRADNPQTTGRRIYAELFQILPPTERIGGVVGINPHVGDGWPEVALPRNLPVAKSGVDQERPVRKWKAHRLASPLIARSNRFGQRADSPGPSPLHAKATDSSAEGSKISTFLSPPGENMATLPSESSAAALMFHTRWETSSTASVAAPPPPMTNTGSESTVQKSAEPHARAFSSNDTPSALPRPVPMIFTPSYLHSATNATRRPHDAPPPSERHEGRNS